MVELWGSSSEGVGRGLGVGGTCGVERLVSTSFLGNPLARNTFSKYRSVCVGFRYTAVDNLSPWCV